MKKDTNAYIGPVYTRTRYQKIMAKLADVSLSLFFFFTKQSGAKITVTHHEAEADAPAQEG